MAAGLSKAEELANTTFTDEEIKEIQFMDFHSSEVRKSINYSF